MRKFSNAISRRFAASSASNFSWCVMRCASLSFGGGSILESVSAVLDADASGGLSASRRTFPSSSRCRAICTSLGTRTSGTRITVVLALFHAGAHVALRRPPLGISVLPSLPVTRQTKQLQIHLVTGKTKTPLLIVRPHPNYFDDSDVFQDLVDKSMLNVDST